jgi:cell division ATPase FtsA
VVKNIEYEREESIMSDNSINRKKIKAVMGLDIGDGDSVAYIRLLTEKDNKPVSLSLHKSRDQQVEPSAVAKSKSGVITIGEDAGEKREFAINFKRSPGNWNSISPLGVPYRQHMSDYIRGVSETILQNSSNRSGGMRQVIMQDSKGDMHWKKEEVLLVVGCPASVIWKGKERRREYEELISETTGISNVMVTEESRAAVYSLFEIDNLSAKINLQAGVLVLDFGSSTADATYVLPGKKAIHISWELGAAKIEEAMLEYILKSDKARKTFANQAENCGKNQIYRGHDQNHAIFQLRRSKEAYFDGKLGEDSTPKNVKISIINEDGDYLIDKNGDSVESLDIPYTVTKAMMHDALDEYEFSVNKDGNPVNHGTWKENCRQFLNDVKQTLEREKLPLQTVVVTGGGSQMKGVVGDLCNKAFPGKVVPSDTPSHSVVKGLVTIAYNEVYAPEVRGKAMGDIRSAAEKNINDMIDEIAKTLSEKAYDKTIDAMKALAKEHGYADTDGFWKKIPFDSNVGEVTRTVNKAIADSLDQNNVKNQIDNSTKRWQNKDTGAIVKCINDVSQQLYADQVMGEMIQISQADVATLAKKVVLPDITMPNVATDANLIGSVVGSVLGVVFFVVLTVIALFVPVIGPILALLGVVAADVLYDKLMAYEKMPVNGTSIYNAARKMEKDKEEKIAEIREKIREPLRETFTKPDVYGDNFEKYYRMLEAIAEKAFDQILLKVEDDR